MSLFVVVSLLISSPAFARCNVLVQSVFLRFYIEPFPVTEQADFRFRDVEVATQHKQRVTLSIWRDGSSQEVVVDTVPITGTGADSYVIASFSLS